MRSHRLLLPVVTAAAAALVATFASPASALPPWVDRTLTLPSGDWAFDFGLGVAHAPPPDPRENELGAGINMEMAVGITNRLELGVRTGLRFGDPFERSSLGDPYNQFHSDQYGRLFDRQYFGSLGGTGALANPEVRVRGALVRGNVFELGLEGRLWVPVEDNTDAGLEFGVPMAFHFGDRVRLDTGAYTPVVFNHPDATFVISAPLDVWIQASPKVWVGPMTGLVFWAQRPGTPPTQTDLSLGVGFGYQITHYLDFKAQFLFPRIDNEDRDFGFGAGIQIRIE
jgi:hypothetical protein